MTAIVDLGSGSTKGGLSGEEKPTCIFNSLLGKPQLEQMLPIETKDMIIGPKYESLGLYSYRRLVTRGILESEKDTKYIFDNLFHILKLVNNQEIPMFIAEPQFTPLKQKNMIADLILNKYDCPKLFFGTQGVLSLYSSGKTEGVCIETGEDLTQIVPVYNGYKIKNSVEKINLGGRDISKFLGVNLRKFGINLNCPKEYGVLKNIKEKVCQISEDRLTDEQIKKGGKIKVDEIDYDLPDGKTLNIGRERLIASELMFNPSIYLTENLPGLDELINSSLSRIDIDLRNYLYESIFLSGGNSHLEGLSQRLSLEMEKHLSVNVKFSITANNTNRAYQVWQGASVMSNLGNSFSNYWITKKKYDEEGERIFLKKHF